MWNSLQVMIFRSNFLLAFPYTLLAHYMLTHVLLPDFMMLVIFSNWCGAMKERRMTRKLIQLSNFPLSWEVLIQTELILTMWCFCPGNSAAWNMRRISKSFVLVRRNFLNKKETHHKIFSSAKQSRNEWECHRCQLKQFISSLFCRSVALVRTEVPDW
jgi:hypothetical protein